MNRNVAFFLIMHKGVQIGYVTADIIVDDEYTALEVYTSLCPPDRMPLLEGSKDEREVHHTYPGIFEKPNTK